MKPVSAREEWPIEGIGQVIKAARLSYIKRTCSTLAKICQTIGVNRSYWYQMENEELRTISLSHLRAIEELFGVELYAIALTDKTVTIKVINNDDR